MAFFGLQWIPDISGVSRASEADPAQLAELAYTIRANGQIAARDKTATLEAAYAQEYHQLEEKQQLMQQWKDYVNSRLTGFTPKDAEKVQNAAFAWRNGDSSYYVYQEGLNDSGKQLIEEYFQFLEVKSLYDTAEATLWDINATLQNTQRIAELWGYEANSAIQQHKNIKLELKAEKKRRNELRRANEAYMKQMRKLNKFRQTRSAAPTTELLREPDRGKNKPEKLRAEQETVDSLLAGLDKIALPTAQLMRQATKANSAPSNSKTTDTQGFFGKWFTPAPIDPKDFI